MFTVRNEVAKVMFLQASVCPQGGGCLPQCMVGYTPPRSRHPTPRSRHSWEQTPPWSRHPPEQTLPEADTPPETATAADGTHPTGMHSCLLMMRFSYSNKETLLTNNCTLNRKNRKLTEFITDNFSPA